MTWETYKQIYTDVWQLHKKHFKNPDYDRFVEEFTAIGAKYNHPFCEALLLAVAEDISKGERNSE